MIRNIVFDMGNVLLQFDPELFMNRIDLNEADRKILRKELWGSVEWIRTDRGSMNTHEAANSIHKRIPERLWDTVDRLIDHWYEPLVPIEGMEEIVKNLKDNGYGIWLLSNAGTNQHDYWLTLPVHRYFDGVMISADEKCLKPSPDIYRCFTEKFQLNPRECLFIDDNPSNVEGAVFCGWEGVVFHGDTEELKRKISEHGIRCFI